MESGEYVHQYCDLCHDRAERVVAHIRRSRGYRTFSVDWSKPSFQRLGQWVLKNIRLEYRLPKKVEISGNHLSPEIRAHFKKWQESEKDYEIADADLPLVLDIGFLVACELMRRFPWLGWKRCSARSSFYFNQPILPARGNYGFAPLFEAECVTFAVLRQPDEVMEYWQWFADWLTVFRARRPRSNR